MSQETTASILLYHLSHTDDPERQALYCRKTGKTLDYTTYFNSLDAKKWKGLTTMRSVSLRLAGTGKWKIVFLAWTKAGRQEILSETFDGNYEHGFSVDELPDGILGFELTSQEAGGALTSGAWYGTFAQWRNLKIGVSICTFRREKYVKKTIATLQALQQENDWLDVLVVDNGQTLQPQEGRVRIIHNPNYGGSGGFTRGLMEYAKENAVDEILLMDDDIILEPTVLERTWAFLCSLRGEHQNRILGGAMLYLEKPTIQHENIAWWPKYMGASFGHEVDLGKAENLVENGKERNERYQYAAWWYAVIPMDVVRKIGYPMPYFIKIDDVEYSVRTGVPPIAMNGIGVWHDFFKKPKPGAKVNKGVGRAMYYYCIRNALMLHHSMPGRGYFHQMYQVYGRIFKRIVHRRWDDTRTMRIAMRDYLAGFHSLAEIPADKKMQSLIEECGKDFEWSDLLELMKMALWLTFHYDEVAKEYREFIDKDLKSEEFWENYLKLGE